MISQENKERIEIYEQLYFSMDKPVPLSCGLQCYPVLVKDYYTFYNSLSCVTMDKSIKQVYDETTQEMKKVSNPKGIGQSYEQYLIEQMEDPQMGPTLTNQLMTLFSLVFHIPKGVFCPKCGKEITYEDLSQKIKEGVEPALEEIYDLFRTAAQNDGVEFDETQIPEDVKIKINQQAYTNAFNKAMVCEECGENMRDTFSIKEENGIKSIMIKDLQLPSQDLDLLCSLIPRQNIIDYDGDEYLDPELKEELELKSKLQNSDYTSPTLEKTMVCIVADTGLSFDYLQTITMRKLSMLLKTVDRKNTYYAQLQASMSGMVEFKEPIKHWIFSDDKHNIAKELTSYDEFKNKFNAVT